MMRACADGDTPMPCPGQNSLCRQQTFHVLLTGLFLSLPSLHTDRGVWPLCDQQRGAGSELLLLLPRARPIGQVVPPSGPSGLPVRCLQTCPSGGSCVLVSCTEARGWGSGHPQEWRPPD